MGSGSRRLSIIWLALAALGGCASAEEPPGPSVTLELSSRSIAARVGEKTSLSVELTQADLSDEDDIVEVSFEGLPSGASGRPLYLAGYARRGQLDMSVGVDAETGVTSAEVVARVGDLAVFRTRIRIIVHDWGSTAHQTGTDGVVSIPPYPYNLYRAYGIELFAGAWSPFVDRGFLVSYGSVWFDWLEMNPKLTPFFADQAWVEPPAIPGRLQHAWDARTAWTATELYVAGMKADCGQNCLVIAAFNQDGDPIPSWGGADASSP